MEPVFGQTRPPAKYRQAKTSEYGSATVYSSDHDGCDRNGRRGKVFLALGHVFHGPTMTGNVVFLGFAIGGRRGVSLFPDRLLALICFCGGCRWWRVDDAEDDPAEIRGVRWCVLWSSRQSFSSSLRRSPSDSRRPYEEHTLKISLVNRSNLRSRWGFATPSCGGTGDSRPDDHCADIDDHGVRLRTQALPAERTLAGKRRGTAIHRDTLPARPPVRRCFAISVAIPLLVCGLMSGICALTQGYVESKDLTAAARGPVLGTLCLFLERPRERRSRRTHPRRADTNSRTLIGGRPGYPLDAVPPICHSEPARCKLAHRQKMPHHMLR